MEDLKRLKSRIDWICEHKVNAFSPTISPAPKSLERNEIESIYEAVHFYMKRGVHDFVFQKKYMGSYCDIYLHKNIEDTYFISRNGHKIGHIDMEAAIEACREMHARFDWNELSIVIIQSELLPWDILGKGLIENEFMAYLNAHQNHLNYLLQSDLYKKIQLVKQSEEFTSYQQDLASLDIKDLKKKYPSHITRQYNSMADFNVIDLEKYSEGIAIYDKQIHHFGQEKTLHFKPFNILKKIFDNGHEEIPNDNLSYAIVNDDQFMTLKVNEGDDLNQSLEPVYNWYKHLASDMEEGIMIKPQRAFIKGLPPAFKVRNNEYLVMIYGVNFINEFDYNIGKRTIRRKLECSTNDWMLNWELLKTKYKHIDKENYAFKNIVLDRILGEQIENTLDHRL